MNVGTYAFAQLLRVLPRTHITRAVGKLCDLPLPAPLSKAVVNAYSRAYDVDLDDAEPLAQAAYPSFDAFFTRPLRSGARNLEAAPGALISPADGRLDALGTVDDGTIMVKGRPYRAEDLLGDAADAERYQGGPYALIYLSPRDYHRVHAPAAGRLVEVRSLPGDLFPVNSISEQHIPNFLVRNRRVAMVMDCGPLGRITSVMVAAMIVGRITVSGIDERDVPLGTTCMDPGLALERGDELGIFHLGSTVVLFGERDAVPTWTRPLGPIQLGMALTAGGEHVDD